MGKLNEKEIKTFFIVIFVLCLIVILSLLVENGTKKEEKIVTKIIDGDTIIVQGGERVRFLGIDCDERGKECYGEAKQFLEEDLLNKKVYLEKGKEDKGFYGRSLRYVFLDGKNVNLELVEKGYCVARFEDEDSKYKNKIIRAEERAIRNNIGCKWGD